MDMFGDDDDGDSVGSLSRFAQLQLRPKQSGVSSFHEGTEESLLLTVESTAVKNEPQSVLDVMDDFCYSRHWMMHIGDVKRVDLDEGLRLARDNVESARQSGNHGMLVVELGSYCGYSAVHLANQLRDGDLLVSIDSSEKAVEWTQRAVNHSGLLHRVRVVHSTAAGSIDTVKTLAREVCGQSSGCEFIGLLLVDHDKAQYLNDLLEFERSGLLPEGSVVVTDNVLSFGQPKQDLLDHVRDPAHYRSSKLYPSALEYSAYGLLCATRSERYRSPRIGQLSESELRVLQSQVEAEKRQCETSDGLEISVR